MHLPQMLDALQHSPPPALVSLQSRLACLYPGKCVCVGGGGLLGGEYEAGSTVVRPQSGRLHALMQCWKYTVIGYHFILVMY